jgi:hypothetical protein
MDEQKRWTNAAIWKWCDLDSHPHDNSVSRHELFPVKAPLQALEHCIGHFLEICDKNDDHGITLKVHVHLKNHLKTQSKIIFLSRNGLNA